LAEAICLGDAIERIVLEFPGYGYRRVTAALQREGWAINPKRGRRVLQQESLLCQWQRRWTRTTESAHGWQVYPNRVKGRVVNRLDALWVADITYIRLPESVAYLAAILDAVSRKVIGGCLSRSLEADVALTALQRALTSRAPVPRLDAP